MQRETPSFIRQLTLVTLLFLSVALVCTIIILRYKQSKQGIIVQQVADPRERTVLKESIQSL